MSVRRLGLSIDSNLDDACLVGLAVGRIASFSGLEEIEACHVEVCVVEAVNNCVRHAYEGHPGHPVRVDVTLSEDALRIEVADRGVPIEASRCRPSTIDFDPEDRAALPTGGLGLPILYEVMDRVEFGEKDGWNVLTLEKRLPAQRATA